MNKEYGYYNNERYAALESLYLSTKDKKYLDQMYEFLIHYYSFKLRKYESQKGFQFPEEKANELIHKMASRSICHYLYHPKIKGDFKMGKLSAYASFDFIKVLFDEKEIEYESREVSLDAIVESYGNNQPAFDIQEDGLDKVDLLIDAEMGLPSLEYQMVKAMVDCPGMNIDDLADMFELPKKKVAASIDKIKAWYKEREE